MVEDGIRGFADGVNDLYDLPGGLAFEDGDGWDGNAW